MPDLHLRLADHESADDDTTADELTPLDNASALQLLERAVISSETLVPWGSNYTFAVALQEPGCESVVQFGIYKPQRGERPLWDFPPYTLFQRERASWVLSDQLGWGIVPPTVVRDGPHGIGSLQLYIAPGEERDEEDTLGYWGQTHVDIEKLVLFDLISNNADRKLTHCLLDARRRVWGIDHGLTFNLVPKLRTVLWQFVGDPISPELIEDIARIRNDEDELRCCFADLLMPEEITALTDRLDGLLATGCHPMMDPNFNVPYGWW